MWSFIKKYSVVIFLFFLVIVLFFLKFLYGEKVSNRTAVTESTPTSTVAIKPTPTIELSMDVVGNYPLYKLMPYETDDFIVSGYIEPLILNVKTLNKSKSLSEIEGEVRNWIKENGVNPDSHKIIWNKVEDPYGNY